jgi:hypothetical protein
MSVCYSCPLVVHLPTYFCLSVFRAVSFGNKKLCSVRKKAQISPDRNTISQEELEQMLGEFDLRSNVNIIFYQFKKGN